MVHRDCSKGSKYNWYYCQLHVQYDLLLPGESWKPRFRYFCNFCFLLSFWGLLEYSVQYIAMMVRVFANAPGDLGSIQGQLIPKIQKMVLGASLVYTQHYKVRIKGKVEQFRERSSTLLYNLKLSKMEPSGHPRQLYWEWSTCMTKSTSKQVIFPF